MPSYGPTMIIDRCESSHHLPRVASVNSGSTISLERDESDEEEGLLRSSQRQMSDGFSSRSMDSFNLLHNHSYGSVRLRASPAASTMCSSVPPESIRFQVVVWDVGPVDVALGRVPMTFRLTMFWNDEEDMRDEDNQDESRAPRTEWSMAGRRNAYERLLCDETIVRTVDVPPVSLLNVVTFDVIGSPEVCVLREQRQQIMKVSGVQQHTTKRLMRWTCLYKATLMQQNMRLDTFPHDEHVLSLKLGILVHRRAGGRWDMNKYSLGLATEDDSQHSTRIPHGLIVDHARVPDFKYNQKEGLDFQFVPTSMGVSSSLPLGQRSPGQAKVRQDCCLEVRLRVARDSGYYDQNIMPLIVMLNIVACVVPVSLESTYFFQRGLLLLNITFVQIGIRMNVDKHLPSVGYQIKMQSIMNQFFFALLFLVLESSMVHVLSDRHGWTTDSTDHIDMVMSGLSLVHIIATSTRYYWDKHCLDKHLERVSSPSSTSKEKMPPKEIACLPV